MGGYASSPLYEDTQLGKPALRLWEITANSTRYDKARAAPSDEAMRNAWTVWSVAFFLFATFNIIVFAGILASRKVRQRPFNLYLIYLMVPDIVYTLFCAIQCATLVANTGFANPSDCHWQSFYLVFGLTANSWLNGVIANELYRLLSFSNYRRKYTPPTLKVVTRNSLLVYLYSILLAGMGCMAYPWWPHRTDLQNGLVCLPMDFDTTSTILFWTVFFPFMSAIPLLYCVGVAIVVYKKGLLPPQGKRREITIYFYKITGVFLIMWLPGIFIFYVLSGVTIWAIYAAPLWSHSQGAVAAGVAMMKKDVYDAVMDLVWCRVKCCKRCCCYMCRGPRYTSETGGNGRPTSTSTTFSDEVLRRPSGPSRLSDRAGLRASIMRLMESASATSLHRRNSVVDEDVDEDIYSQGSLSDGEDVEIAAKEKMRLSIIREGGSGSDDGVRSDKDEDLPSAKGATEEDDFVVDENA